MTTVGAGGLDLRFSIAGPGRVGTSLARWLVQRGARLSTVASRRVEDARDLTEEIGGEPIRVSELDSSDDWLVLITVADEAIGEVALALAARPQAAVALHASGSVAVEALAPLRDRGTEIGGLHPLRAFPSASLDVSEAHELLFAVGGDEQARRTADEIVEAWGGVAAPITDDQRILYHLAASLAAGGVVTLLATVAGVAERAGLPETVLSGYYALAHQALGEASSRAHPAAAITGPIARGDAQTIERYFSALSTADPDSVEVAATLAGETLRQLSLHGRARDDHRQVLRTLSKVLERKSFLDRD